MELEAIEIEIEIPCYFICPISMQLMQDPVTVSTGITYDRENIEKWLFLCKNTTCPVTKQHLQNTDLTPNHTLRRLIQAWCTINAYERIPTPKPTIDKSQIRKLLNEAENSPRSKLFCLHRLRSIAHRNESSRNNLIQSSDAVEFLFSVVRKHEDSITRDEALNILHQIQLSETDLKKFVNDDTEILNSLLQVLQNGHCQARAHAVMLLKSAFNVADPGQLIGSKPEVFMQIVRILKDGVSQKATRAALKMLIELCPWGRNRIKAVESDAVLVLIELLLEMNDKRGCELVLIVLDQLCGCAEGRAELLKHAAGLAVVSKKILRVSHVVSERCVRILSSISRYSANGRVLQEMLQVGVVSKLCLVLQVESSVKTKERAKEILKVHARVWKDSPCIPPHLMSSYPSPN